MVGAQPYVISLKKTIEAYDFRSMWQAALDSYVAAIQSLDRHAVAVDQEGLNAYRAGLRELTSRLETTELSPAVLRDISTELDAEIGHYRIEVEYLLKESAADLKDVVSVLAEATESLSQRENLHGNQLSRISGSLEAISQIDDLAQVRLTLNRQVSDLRTCISSMARDNENAIFSLQKEITVFQQKLEKVQVEASTDPLTGIANRRRCLREISNRIRSRSTFGILLFDLNKFKEINDTLGHAGGDAVLQLISQRLSLYVSKEDLVCRWGGDEFVIVHDGGPEELAARGRRVAEKISGQFPIRFNNTEHEVSIGAEFGWAEYRAGETPEHLFARADQMLYDTKADTKAPQLKLETAPSVPPGVPADTDTATGLPKMESLEKELAQLEGSREDWFLACFAIRSAARVNNHYGFPATDTVLPFLRDDLQQSRFGSNLFRGRGATLLALVHLPDGAAGSLEEELRRICNTGLEKHLKQKRRASILPIAVGGKVFASLERDCLREINAFIEQQRAGDQLASSAAPVRGMERMVSPPKR
jgi:diguanylate cyclase (GGDEF)-like protein